MSVLCCRIPNFLVGLAYRDHPDWANRPLALLGADERVWAASPEARMSGVCLEMNPRQAQMHCPDVLLQPLDVTTGQSEQSAFVGTLAQCGLPVEEQTWGLAYVDLHLVATTAQSVQPIAAEMGKQVRRQLSESLPASAGWDTGKFTARAAASFAKPGHMRLVDRADESRFLNPLPVTLLPLPPLALQQLDWLGIHTLEQFARLPATAVWQRFGAAGKLAQRWAQGRDDRPVSANTKTTPQPISIDFDPPATQEAPVLQAALAALRPPLRRLEQQLEGCRRLRLELKFDDGSRRVIECAFVEPVSEGRRLRTTLSHQLQTLSWPAGLTGLDVLLLASGELAVRQLALFETDPSQSPLLQLAQKLSHRHGAAFFQAQLSDEGHPVAERRAALVPLAGAST